MPELHYRALAVADVDGRTLHGVALTFNRAYRVSDDGGQHWYHEGWRPGSLDRSINHCHNTFELRSTHRDVRVGLCSFEASPTQVYFRAPLDESDDGQRVLDQVTAGALRGVSVAFRPRSGQRDAELVRWYHRADIRELSMTPRGQYEDARVTHVRSGNGLAEALRALASADAFLSSCDLTH